MTRVTVKYPDENWNRWEAAAEYKPIEYLADLVNVLYINGVWTGVISIPEDGLIQTIEMSKIVEWHEHDNHYYPW